MLPSEAYPDKHGSPEAEKSEGDGDLEAGPLSPSRQQTRRSLGAVASTTGLQEAPTGRWHRIKAWCGVRWRRTKTEFRTELPLLKTRALVIVLCLAFQYVHAVFTTLAYHLHEPLPEPLHDIGFLIFPELGLSKQAVTEAMVYTGFGAFGVWLVSPFVMRRKTLYAVVVLKRVLVMLVSLQALRIITFLSTQIPGPNYHCLAGQPEATLDWPEHWWQNIIVNVSQQASHSCGDLIFSSHTTFLLVFMWTYLASGRWLALKILSVLYVAATSCLIIASRKHYTVDIVVAWYVVPLAFFHFRRRWTTLRDDVATPDGNAVVPNELPISAAGEGPKGALGGLQRLMGKLRRASTPPKPVLAVRADSVRLLGRAEEGTGAVSARGAGAPEAAEEEGVVVEIDLGAGFQRAAGGSEGGDRSSHGRDRSGHGDGSYFSTSPSKRSGGGGGSPVRDAMRGILSTARALPQRVGSLREQFSPASSQYHRRNESADSSTAVLRGEGGVSSSMEGAA